MINLCALLRDCDSSQLQPPMKHTQKANVNYKSNIQNTNPLFAQQKLRSLSFPFFCHIGSKSQNEISIHNKCLRNILCVKIYLQLKPARPKIVDKSFNYYFNFVLIIHELSLIRCIMFELRIHAIAFRLTMMKH